jgi:hypothetical protein
MAFLSRLFSRAESAPLPLLETLLQERGLPRDIPGLDDLVPDFEHQDAEDRERWVDALVELREAGFPLPPMWPDVQEILMPELVPTWKGERDGFYFKPFVEGLCQQVLVGTQRMPDAWLTLWGVAEDDVLERALDQLRERSRKKPFQRLPSGIYESTFGDGLDASRLLLPELWEDLFPGQNTFVAVPNPGRLLVAPQVLLPKLVEAVNDALGNDADRLFATIFQVLGNDILPANLHEPHPIAQPQRELRQSDLLHAYRAQEEALDPALGAIAPVGIMRTQQGRSISYTLWSEGRPVLLPETDMIVFVNAKGKPLGMYIRKTMPRISELRGVPVDIWGPTRLRYEGFPTAEQLSRLECAANGEQVHEIIKASPGQGRPSAPQAAPPQMAQAASPVPPHLRGLNLGMQSKDE